MRREAAVRTPPPVRSKGAPGGVRQASPRVLAIAGGVVVVAAIAVVLGIVLSRGGKPAPTDLPKVGSATWEGALQGSTDVRKLFKGIPEKGLVLGPATAPVTLTEFIDLQCPDCQYFETQELPTLIQKYVRTGKLNIRMQPWAIRGPASLTGQSATIAASLQNKGFQFAEMLYLNQGVENSGWLNENMVGLASASVDGLRASKVLSDMSSSRVKSVVTGVDQRASTGGFDATPTILLNKRGRPEHVLSVGVPNMSTLESEIESAARS